MFIIVLLLHIGLFFVVMFSVLYCYTLWYLWIFITRTSLYITFQYCLWAHSYWSYHWTDDGSM